MISLVFPVSCLSLAETANFLKPLMYIGVKVFQCDKRKALVPLWLCWETSTKALAICNKFFFRKGTIYNSNFPNLHTLILLTFTVNVGNSNPSFLRLKLKQTVLVLRIIFITWVNFKIRGKSINLYYLAQKWVSRNLRNAFYEDKFLILVDELQLGF